MTNEPTVTRVIVDIRRNQLVLELGGQLAGERATCGTIDIGAFGRLIGIEVAGAYLAIADPVPGSELQGRSVEVAIDLDPDRRRMAIPRRGPTWELSFPSGNQCWNRCDEHGGTRTLCSVLAGT